MKKSVVYTSIFLNFFHQEIINVLKENRKLGNFKGSQSLFRNRLTKNLSTNNCVFLINGHASQRNGHTDRYCGPVMVAPKHEGTSEPSRGVRKTVCLQTF